VFSFVFFNDEASLPRDLERGYGRVGLRVLERNLKFPEKTLDEDPQGTKGLDAVLVNSTMN
jgi:hypothetical protein